ncbi:MAG: helix-turn-helix transcriptional regulator [Clostridia bacterium]|jgi:transcriptional regulator with XRE-family HTH domain|nr:helix-turn-helix transcriptional regulator [Clostridia bacterium]
MSEKPREEVIAQNLALYRKLHGFTQAQLADAIGYSDKSISKWERGDGTPDIFLLLTLSEIYGITVSELVGQTEKCKSTQEKIKYAEHDRKELERAKKKALERAKKQKKHNEKK